MIEISIDKDEYYPYYFLQIVEKDEWCLELKFNISEKELDELLKLDAQFKLYQTKLKQLFELHGGII